MVDLVLILEAFRLSFGGPQSGEEDLRRRLDGAEIRSPFCGVGLDKRVELVGWVFCLWCPSG